MKTRGITKAIVLQAAVELADSIGGLDQITLAQLAQKLKIKTPSLYNHVDGMPGLRKELAYWGLRKLKEQLTDAAIGKSGEDALLAMGLAYVAFVRQHPGLYEAVIGAPDREDATMQSLAEDVIQLLLRVMEVFHFDRDDALHTIRGFRSIVHGFATLELKNGFGLALDRDESLRRLLNTFLAGLRVNDLCQ
jgi:AcrR family transcriptional regulator